jgi:hypothetical protein
MEKVGKFNGHLEYITAIWYILRPFGILMAIWYIVSRKIWQPWCRSGRKVLSDACF